MNDDQLLGFQSFDRDIQEARIDLKQLCVETQWKVRAYLTQRIVKQHLPTKKSATGVGAVGGADIAGTLPLNDPHRRAPARRCTPSRLPRNA